MNRLLYLCFLTTLFILLDGCALNCPKETAKWVKSEHNPVIGGPEFGTCFDVNVISAGPAKFNMYFSWRPQKSIAVARSDDGYNWSNPIIVMKEDSTSGWEEVVNRSTTLFRNGKYHMWYTGQSDNKTRSCIGYAVSDDGLRYDRVKKEPVLSAEMSYEGFFVMNPCVLWDDDKEIYRMWYSIGYQGGGEPNMICYAESKDGINWDRNNDNPIFTPGVGDVWDKDRVSGCEVQKLKDGRYIMFYIGFWDENTARIGAAISDDGITNWKRLKSNPLVEPTPGSWDSDACYKPSAVYDEENDRWMLWYNGRCGSPEYVGLVTHEGYYLGETE